MVAGDDHRRCSRFDAGHPVTTPGSSGGTGGLAPRIASPKAAIKVSSAYEPRRFILVVDISVPSFEAVPEVGIDPRLCGNEPAVVHRYTVNQPK